MTTTTIVVPESEGRGAWRPEGHATGSLYYTYKPPLPKDGSNPDDSLDAMWVDRVRRGIVAIRGLLTEHGYPTTSQNPERFDKGLNDAVIAFQSMKQAAGVYCPNDGYVGQITMAELLRPLVLSTAVTQKVHPRWLWGICVTESGLDPGAQGEDNPPDSGLAQFNLDNGAVTIDQAYNPRVALRLLARRWNAALETFESENRGLTLSCAVAQHRSPAAAADWFRTGKGEGTIVQYVADVRLNAQDW